MQKNNFGVFWGTIRFFMQVLESHKDYVVSYVRDQDILFHISVSSSRACMSEDSKTVDVVLAGGYITSETSVLEFHAAFPSAKFIVLGGNWWKYTSEAWNAAIGLGIRLLTLKEFLSALYSRNLVE